MERTVNHPVLGEIKVFDYEGERYYRAYPVALKLGYKTVPRILKNHPVVYTEEQAILGRNRFTRYVRYVGLPTILHWLKNRNYRATSDLAIRYKQARRAILDYHFQPLD